MTRKAKLNIVKSLHTLIWVFFNVVIFFLLYAVIADKIDKWVWICMGLICVEGIVLLIFKSICPVTLIARKYSDSASDNFVPAWLARHNKLIYSMIVLASLVILFY